LKNMEKVFKLEANLENKLKEEFEGVFEHEKV
jgi:hypothetical protein